MKKNDGFLIHIHSLDNTKTAIYRLQISTTTLSENTNLKTFTLRAAGVDYVGNINKNQIRLVIPAGTDLSTATVEAIPENPDAVVSPANGLFNYNTQYKVVSANGWFERIYSLNITPVLSNCVIKTEYELRGLNNSNQDCVLGQSIVLSSDKVWEPIQNFTGNLDGKGYTIDGLVLGGAGLDQDYNQFLGLFSTLDNPQTKIKNLYITGPIAIGAGLPSAATGDTYATGILAGRSTAEITNVNIRFINTTLTHAVTTIMGGVVGYMYGGSIQNSSVRMQNVFGLSLGGLVGVLQGGSIKDSYTELSDITGGYITALAMVNSMDQSNMFVQSQEKKVNISNVYTRTSRIKLSYNFFKEFYYLINHKDKTTDLVVGNSYYEKGPNAEGNNALDAELYKYGTAITAIANTPSGAFSTWSPVIWKIVPGQWPVFNSYMYK